MSHEFETNTSQWSLVVLRTSQDTVTLWLGTLFPTLTMPKLARIDLQAPDGTTTTKEINKDDWQRPFRKIRQRFYTTVSFDNLQPGKHYKAQFSRRIEALDDIRNESWQALRSAQFTTLPKRLPAANRAPFTIGLGSCFYNHRDGGQAAGAYRALYERGRAATRPDITFLTGDQVYLDIGFDSLSTVKSEIRQRIADDYAQHWQALGSILNRGATWMLPDDHEFWNDYPFYESAIPTLLALKLDSVRETWQNCAADGVANVQQSPRVEHFDIGTDLSCCLADLRSYRDNNNFLPKEDFARLVQWAKNLKCPGVLALPQPLIVEQNKTERNLLSKGYKRQYKLLIKALGASGHDIVLLSGDVHFGRIASAGLGPKGGRLIEVIASPMSNLTYLNGIATSTPNPKPKHFPDPKTIKNFAWKASPVQRSKAVSTKRGWLLSAYPKARTREHFMTLGFKRANGGKIQLSINAWRIRERDNKNLPARDFDEYTTHLK